MNVPDNLAFFQLGARLAWPASAAAAALALLWMLLTGIPVFPAVAATAAVFAVLFLFVYLAAVLYMKHRLEVLRGIIRDSARKSMAPDSDGKQQGDELDQLIQDAGLIRTAIHREFERMDQTENYRKEFIGDISHELKTPIFTIQGFIETLLDGALDDPNVNRQFLSKAMKNANRLINLTNDLMEISRLETGELKPALQVIPVNAVIQDVIESLQYKADHASIAIHFNKSEANIFVLTDRDQLRQVLVNLIENAIKYNKPDGHVYINTRYDPKDPSRIRVSIRDTGLGIDAADVKRVTERFFRVDKSRSREQGGTGLGLSIVKHILESHKEQLVIESQPGVGSLFEFTLKNADYHASHVTDKSHDPSKSHVSGK